MENISWYIWVFGGIVSFLLSMVLVFAVHPFVVKIANSRGLTDNPGERKLQQRPVPVLGGVAVFFGIVVGAIAGQLAVIAVRYWGINSEQAGGTAFAGLPAPSRSSEAADALRAFRMAFSSSRWAIRSIRHAPPQVVTTVAATKTAARGPPPTR